MFYDLSKTIDMSTIDLDELTAKADAGDPSALFLGSYMLEGGFNRNVPLIDYPHSFEWAGQGAAQKDTLCTARYASLLHVGLVIEKDEKQAVKIFTPVEDALTALAEDGSPYAQTLKGYSLGQGFRKHSHINAFEWYGKAAAQGEPVGTTLRAHYFYRGYDRPVDFDEAFALYKQAADTGFAQGQYRTALCLMAGEGVAKDEAEGMRLCQQAADQGLGEAQNEIATRILAAGGPDADAEALAWFHKATDACDMRAKFSLAQFLEAGRGGERNMAAAFGYYGELAQSMSFARIEPLQFKTAQTKAATMQIGKPRERTEDGGSRILFPDGSSVVIAGRPQGQPGQGKGPKQGKKHRR